MVWLPFPVDQGGQEYNEDAPREERKMGRGLMRRRAFENEGREGKARKERTERVGCDGMRMACERRKCQHSQGRRNNSGSGRTGRETL